MKEQNLRWSLRSVKQFSDCEDEWQQLNRAGSNLPILDAQFYRLLATEFSSGEELAAICRVAEKPVAAALIQKSRTGAWQAFQPSQAPLGAWLHSPEYPLDSLLGSLLRELPGFAIMLGLTQIDPDVFERPRDSSNIASVDYIQTARITVNGSFSDYWASRGRNLRQNIKRQRNRLKREETIARLEIVTSPDALDDAVDEFGLLESKGWKGEAGTALHPDNSQGRFYRVLMKKYAERSEAIVYRYFYGDRLVATDLCLLRDGVMLIMKTAHDEQQKTTSPAMLMRQEAFETIFDNGSFNRIEFYGRLMDWHRKWTSEIRTMYHANFFRSAAIGGLWRAFSST